MSGIHTTHNSIVYLPFDNTVVVNDGKYTNRNVMTIVLH